MIGLSSLEGGASGAADSGSDVVDGDTFLLSDEFEAFLELRKGDSPLGLVLDLGEDEVDVGGSELLVEQLAVLGHLGEGFALHGFLGAVEGVEDLLERGFHLNQRYLI